MSFQFVMQANVQKKNKQSKVSQTSSLPSSWNGRRPIAIFVRCLRLLDLDLKEGWPNITEATFSTSSARQNLQTRIKCVEWSLYRLLEIWDPVETKDKLRPFFPPSTPLQSMNLRAAIYRALTELKKNGTLGRDLVLRKTMFDECKGEKFEEVISSLALLVLKKVADTNGMVTEHVRSTVLSDRQERELIPLIIAHRGSIQSQLAQRKELQNQAELFERFLKDRQTLIEKRTRVLSQSQPPGPKTVPATLSNTVLNAWTGDDRWADILTTGLPVQRDSLLDCGFETAWESVQQQKVESNDSSQTLLDKLNSRVAIQEARMKQWMKFQASIQNVRQSQSQSVPSRHVQLQKSQNMVVFDKHQALNISSHASILEPENLFLPNSSHTLLLESMRSELDELNDPAKRVAKRTSLEEFPENLTRPSKSKSSRDLAESPPHGEPKRTYISNESDLVESINNLSLRGEDARIATNTQLKPEGPSKLKFDHSSIELPSFVPPAIFPSSSPIPSSYVESGKKSLKATSPTELTSLFSPENPSRTDGTTNDAPEKKIGDTPRKTNKSMTPALSNQSVGNPKHSIEDKNFEKELGRLNPESSLPSIVSDSIFDDTDAATEEDTHHYPSLFERTRQSLSLLPTLSELNQIRPARKSHAAKIQRASQNFPVNQFEISQKQTGKDTKPSVDAPTSGASTPRDKLFSDDADYASVFKSRPRIALSPALSPDRSILDFDGIAETDSTI